MIARGSRSVVFALAAIAWTASSAEPAAAQAAERGAFVVLMGADTFAVERFSHAADRLEGEITGASLGRMVWSAAPGPDGELASLHLSAWRPGAASDASPMQTADIRVIGDSATAEIGTPSGGTTQRFATREGASIYLNPSFLQVEQLARRAPRGGEALTVPLLLAQGGQTMDASVRRIAPDSVAVSIAGSEIRIAVDPAGRMTGGAIPAQNLRIVRVAEATPAAAAPPPDYTPPADATYDAEEVIVDTPAGHRLVGTLTRPRSAGRAPAVVTISGSGPQDRDSAIPILPGYRPFREIADTLSRRGIAVLRLDDRGTGASTGEFSAATSADFADDVRAAIEYLRARADVDPDRIALVGHSEGGMIAPMVAATDARLSAIALVAGTARTGREIIAFQQRQAIENNPAIPAEARDSVYADVAARFGETTAGSVWIRYFLDHDPLATARRVASTPVLVLHGETDRQVTVDQAEMLAEAFREAGNPDVTVVVLPDVNHLLLRDPDGNPALYSAIADRSVVPEARGALADWLAERLGADGR
jgi:uncharacterized protein